MGDDRGPYCSLCFEPQDDDSVRTLRHVQREHYDADEFQAFVSELVVRNYCARCGEGFWSDVESISPRVFGARPYCVACRGENRALKDLLVDHMDAGELVARGLLRPDRARRSREARDHAG